MYRNRIAEHIIIDSAELRRNPLNHRRHPDSQRHALRQLLGSVGVIDELLAYRDPEHGLTLVDGEARWSEGGSWPVAVLDLTPDEARLALAMLDQIGAQAEIDPDALIALLDSLPAQARQTAGAAWSDDELAALLEDARALPEPGGGGDEFDPTPEDGETRTALGELWIIGGKHRLLVGDCTDPANVERLMGGEKADMAWTDPPYGVEYQGTFTETEKIEGDDKGMSAVLGFVDALDKRAPVYICCDFKSYPELFISFNEKKREKIKEVIIWDKTEGKERSHVPPSALDLWISSTEWIVYSGMLNENRGYSHNVIHYGRIYAGSVKGEQDSYISDYEDKLSHLHPTIKPLYIIERCLEAHPDARSIIDPYAGTGGVLVAAHRTNRRAYLMEIAPRYADVILRRAEAEGLTVERAPA